MKLLQIQTIIIAVTFLSIGCDNNVGRRVKLQPTPTPKTQTALIVPPSKKTGLPSPPLESAGPLPHIGLRLIASYLDEPTYITHAGDGSGRLFILERRGKIRVIENDQMPAEPFLDITDQVYSDGYIEQGLLGLAFHPDFPDDPRFFVYYSVENNDTVLVSYEVSPDLRQGDKSTATVLLTIPQPFTNHNGGQVAFGPDGYLYLALGEGGLSKDPGPDSLLGKILRLDIDSGDPYSIPEDNPFIDNPDYRPEIWALGLRNPWRFSFDRQTGDLYIADVGQNLFEEIDFEPGDSPGGNNYGWPIMEGYHCYESETCDSTGLTFPITEYGRESGCSVTGGYVYRGGQYPEFDGLYIYADYCTGTFWTLRPEYKPAELFDTILNVSSFGEDEAGEIYVVNFVGDVYKLVAINNNPQTNNWPGAWPLADSPIETVKANFEGEIRLVGYTANQPLNFSGGIVELTLFWQGQQIPETSNVFVQIIDQNDNTIVQADHPLYIHQDVLTADGTMLRDGATLALPPDMPNGSYKILVGLYNPETSERLKVINGQSGQSAVPLTEFAIE